MAPACHAVDIRLFPAFRGLVKTPFARRAATAALKVADPGGDRDVSVVIADDETLHDLNLRYRGFDEPTDVLSFGDESDASLAEEDADDGPAFPEMPGESLPLGRLCCPTPWLFDRQASTMFRLMKRWLCSSSTASCTSWGMTMPNRTRRP
jgi:hypothetical protein